MDVLVTGAYGRCGTAIIDYLHDDPDYKFTYMDRSDCSANHPYGGFNIHVADIMDYDAIRPVFEDKDAIVHLAAYPSTDGDWKNVFGPNVLGMYNVLEAARDASVETFIFGSTNHVMGMYETEHAPELYEPGYDLLLDYTDPVRPDSYYGTTKSFGEDLGRYYVENYEYPKQFYALRICTVNSEKYDHPYGDAEQQVKRGDIIRGSEEYKQYVNRMKSMWQSRRDFAHQIKRCLYNNSVSYGIFSGVSDNDRRWFAIERARTILGYKPQDNGDKWDEPPTGLDQK